MKRGVGGGVSYERDAELKVEPPNYNKHVFDKVK